MEPNRHIIFINVKIHSPCSYKFSNLDLITQKHLNCVKKSNRHIDTTEIYLIHNKILNNNFTEEIESAKLKIVHKVYTLSTSRMSLALHYMYMFMLLDSIKLVLILSFWAKLTLVHVILLNIIILVCNILNKIIVFEKKNYSDSVDW